MEAAGTEERKGIVEINMPAVGKSKIVIYLLMDSDGNPRYIGKTDNLTKRVWTHRRNRPWVDRGVELEVVASDARWQDRERYWIAYYRQFVNLDNITRGGNGCGPVSEATRRKLSAALSRVPRTPEWVARVAAASSRALTGRKIGPQSPEHTAKIIATKRARAAAGWVNPLKGRSRSLEICAKISAGKMGCKIGDVGRANMSAIQSKIKTGRCNRGRPSPFKGIPRSPETRARVSAALRAMWAAKRLAAE